MRTRMDWLACEDHWLAPYACRSRDAHATRRHPEPEHAYRAAFQRDRDRLVHARAFRRLKHKRQVFLITEGDHFRTRMTHTLEVAQISRTLARALALNEDLVEAIALGHDLGHTPFGHLGEHVLDDILQGRDTLEGSLSPQATGGFKHNYQSLRVVDWLEQKYTFPGLNLTAAVREGILKHTRLKRGQYHYPDLDTSGLAFEQEVASTLEGQVVAVADEVAQRTHDFEDGLRAGLVALEDIAALELVQLVQQQSGLAKLRHDHYLYCNRLIHGLVNLLVSDLIEETLRRVQAFEQREHRCQHFTGEIVAFSATVDAMQRELNKFIYQQIIFRPEVRHADEDARQVLRTLFRLYLEDARLLPPSAQRAAVAAGPGTAGRLRQIADFIAGMTDHFALAEFQRLRSLGLAVPDIALQDRSHRRHLSPPASPQP
ncbi:MAG: dNTP triphosphohydrolase [candidate division KSB1 bacterium]|nr:dNTP triphosphohydrolase [candidate division KSB1 bacterium]MDZ7275215.1 dNTP triphosphohydrolase [candidate division KSB1 bacterium]MDZ7287384.1 dNTP triphosphohydrolase [candidate division KSB1 bacterium]MDZ7299498.1 dNTP triphosphohydrolase [candidate division KSB1 bacterium]MDZ7305456.1 dNTP triphosphohydrolase [candidate division KSB1 bacterium]